MAGGKKTLLTAELMKLGNEGYGVSIVDSSVEETIDVCSEVLVLRWQW